MWQRKLQELQCDIAISPPAPDGMPFQHTNNTSDPTFDKAARLAKVSDNIEKKIIEIQETVYDIETFILTVEDPLMRQILQYRCIECKTWEEIGSIVHYNRTSITRRYNRFIKEKFAHFAH